MAARNSDLYKKVLTFAWEYYTASQSQREQLIQRYGVQAKEYALFIASKDPIRYQTNNLRGKITVKTLNEIFRVFYSKDRGSRSDYEILQLSLNKGLDYLNPEDEQIFERIEKTEDPEQKAKEIEKKIQEKTEKKYKTDSAEVTKITPKKPNEKPSIRPAVTSPIKKIQPIPTPSIIKKLTAFFNPQPIKPPQAIPLPAQPQKVQAIKKQPQKTFTQILPVFTRDTLNFLKPVGLDALSKAKIQTRRIILKNPFEVGSLINGLIWSGIVYSQTGELGTALVTGLVATIAPYAARDILQKRTVGGPGFLESRPKINSDRSNILKNRAAGFISQRISSFTLSNPWVLGTIAVLVIILLLFIFPFLQKGTSYLCPYSGNCLTDNESRQTEKSFEILKSGPVSVENGQKITYQISIKNLSQQALDALVTDIIQRNTKYIESEPAGELSGADENGNGGTITWKLDKVSPSSTKVISLIIEPQENDIWVINEASAKIAESSVTPGEDIPPTTDSCGTYKLTSPKGNFGDPKCDFDKDKLFSLLKQSDSQNAEYWFLTVIRLESQYNPNAFNGNSTSGQGAYGLYQMNPTGRGNGEFDRGDVNWQLQTSNAINYNSLLTRLGRTWCYWEAAKDRWRNCR